MVTLLPSITGKTAKPIAGITKPTAEINNITIEAGDNPWWGTGQPITLRRSLQTNAPGTDRLYFTNLDFFWSYEGGYWNGGTADIYVITNGARTLLGSGTVTGGATYLRDYYFGDNTVTTVTTAEIKHNTFWRPNHAYYYRVAAVDGSGGIGTWTAWQSFTTPATIPASTATNTNTAALTFNGTSALAAPTSFSIAAKSGDAGTAVLTWNAVSGAAGYVVERDYQNPANSASSEDTQYLDIDTTSLSIPAEAHVVLSKKCLTPPTAVCARIWETSTARNAYRPTKAHSIFSPQSQVDGTAGEWVAYTGGDPAPTGVVANYFARNHHQTSGEQHRHQFHSGENDIFYDTLEVGRQVTFTVTLRSIGAGGNFTMNIQGVDNLTGDTSFTSTTDWATYTVTSTQSTVRTGTTIYYADLTVNNTNKYDIAHIAVYTTGVDQNDMPPDIKDDVPAGAFIRDHRHIKPGETTNSLENLVLPGGFGARKNGAATLHSFLWQCKTHNANPWIQLEWFHTEQDWIDLVAYLCAPVSSGNAWALARQDAGQTAPWWNEFDKIFVEFGNEAWNTLAEFWNPPGGMVDTATAASYSRAEHYGLICQQMIDAMKTSPWWTMFNAKTRFIIGGHRSSTFGEDALPFCPDAYCNSIAGYQGGWEVTTEPVNESGDAFLNAIGLNTSSSDWIDRYNATAALSKEIIVYEAGPGYGFPGKFSKEVETAQEVVLKSRGGSVGTLYSYLYRANLGFRADNFFRLQTGQYWTSHAAAGIRTGEPFITYGLIKLIEDAVGMCQVKELTKTTNPTRPQDGTPATKAFLLRSLSEPTTCVIAALNLNIDVSLLDPSDSLYSATPSGLEQIVINTPILSCTGLEYFANVGNFREHNRWAVGERLNLATQVYEADSLCVSIPTSWTPGTPLGDASQITIDDTYGAEPTGLKAGNCVLIKMTGCVFE